MFVLERESLPKGEIENVPMGEREREREHVSMCGERESCLRVAK